jgi:hypothetical protein
LVEEALMAFTLGIGCQTYVRLSGMFIKPPIVAVGSKAELTPSICDVCSYTASRHRLVAISAERDGAGEPDLSTDGK